MNALHIRAAQAQTQTQTQTLAPCLQEAVRLLQLSSLDFVQEMRAMAGNNPFLENEEDERAEAEPPDEPGPEHEAWQWDGLEARNGAPGPDGGDFDALSLLPAQTSLADHLHSQLNLLVLEPRDLMAAHAIVDSLDDDGLLRTPLGEIAPCTGLAPAATCEEMRIARCRVQSLDPVGVGACSLQECLRLQARQIECPVQRALVLRIVDDHLPTLAATRDGMSLARLLELPVAQVQDAVGLIRRMEPRPASRFGTEQSHHIIPDVVVSKVRGRWTPRLNPAIKPGVRINRAYVDLFERHRARGDGPMAGLLRDARWALGNLQQRFVTILGVAKSIVERQPGFFDHGEMAIKPMALRDVAAEVGLHESTVCRVTNNKYMATRHGVFELKHFFSRAMTSSTGGEFSGKAVRELVAAMIRTEPASAPLTDAELTRRLARQGLVICRRTVTKYRNELKLLSAERRLRMVAAA